MALFTTTRTTDVRCRCFWHSLISEMDVVPTAATSSAASIRGRIDITSSPTSKGGRSKVLAFVKQGETGGWDKALQAHYKYRSVEELELSVRSYNCLKNANITTIRELVLKSEQEMLKTKNFGRKSLNEIKEILSTMGLSLGMKFDEKGNPIRPTQEASQQQI